MVIAVLVILLLVALYILLIMPRAMGKPDVAPFLIDYAHRGLFDNKTLPENSLGAFQNAVKHGFAIELDVQLSRDGEVMVFHDYTLTRVCGVKAKLCNKTAKELSEISLLGTQYTVPTLREVLELVDGKVPLLIELKGEAVDDELCWKVGPMLDVYDGEYCVESFNPFLLRWFKKHRPEVVRGQLVTNLVKSKSSGNFFRNFMLSGLLANFLSRPDFIAADERYLRDIPIRLCCSLFGTPLLVWTVRKKEHFDINRENGDHSIFEGFEPDVI